MPLLDVDHIHKRYATTHAVNDLSFQVDTGQIFALLGPNGAGKTSTVRMLIGLTEPDRGLIRYQGLGAESPHIIAGELGYLPEERGLYQDQKIIDVLIYFGQLRAMSRTAAREAALHWLERFQLIDRQKEKVSALSKGNQQKIQLIAAMLHKPRLLVLDEPFSGLDPINQDIVVDLLRDLRAHGATILLSAHQMALVERLADRLLLMNRGRQVLAGTLDEIRRDSGMATTLSVALQEPLSEFSAWHLPGVVDIQDEQNGHYKLTLTQEADLNALLTQLANGPRIKRLHSEAIALHDIYVRAVARNNGEIA